VEKNQRVIRFLQKRFAKLAYPVAWTLIIGILLALPGSMLPKEKAFAIPQFDKVVHISLFGGFVFLWNLWLAKRAGATGRIGIAGRPTLANHLLRRFFIIFALGCIYGTGMEYVQKYFIPGRDFDLADIIADMIGAGLAYGLSNIWLLPEEAE
jgi:hypothetical protein